MTIFFSQVLRKPGKLCSIGTFFFPFFFLLSLGMCIARFFVAAVYYKTRFGSFTTKGALVIDVLYTLKNSLFCFFYMIRPDMRNLLHL